MLLVVFAGSIPLSLSAGPTELEIEAGRDVWPLRLAVGLLAVAAVLSAFVADWFVEALQPAMATLGISEEFAGLVIVAIAGNAVEHVVGVQIAMKNKADLAMSLIQNSSLQVALALMPALVIASAFIGPDADDAGSLTAARRLARAVGDPGRARRHRRRVELARGPRDWSGSTSIIAASVWCGHPDLAVADDGPAHGDGAGGAPRALRQTAGGDGVDDGGSAAASFGWRGAQAEPAMPPILETCGDVRGAPPPTHATPAGRRCGRGSVGEAMTPSRDRRSASSPRTRSCRRPSRGRAGGRAR